MKQAQTGKLPRARSLKTEYPGFASKVRTLVVCLAAETALACIIGALPMRIPVEAPPAQLGRSLCEDPARYRLAAKRTQFALRYRVGGLGWNWRFGTISPKR